MSETVSTSDIRQRIGDILNRVALRHDEFVVARKGKRLAAIVPMARLEQMRRYARLHALAYLEGQGGAGLSPAQTAALADAARRYARRDGNRRRGQTRGKK
ncbi:MAG: type II toxin-antitoxin system prevent-host-death family antitoxin [Rhodospirillales bacterium]